MNIKTARNRKEKPLELLAPAGNLEAGYAALHYGADAVYLGMQSFSARASAVNFSLDELADITGYAHALPRRRNIYAAVNTLVLQEELGSVIDLLADIAAIGVDAVIVQDLGVLAISRRYFPQIKIHASTQMAIHNYFGVKAALEMGISRVTLARELTLAEIAGMAAMPGMETEVFIHGALCYSYSGLCLFSSHLYGRSGNRGQCAYPCREWFRADISGKSGFIFSMKDLALPEYVAELRRSGVTALKIEGRMKSPLYVAAVVNYYRKIIDGKLSHDQADKLAAELRTIFSRPWTELYLKNRKKRDEIDPEFVGHRGFPVGKVEKIIKSARGHGLRFKTSMPIELHDGLQFDISGFQRPFGFAVKDINIIGQGRHGKTTRAFTAPAGSIVEIPLPREHPLIPLDAVVYSASSQQVKQKYGFTTPKAGQYRPRQTADFTVKIDAKGFDVVAVADIMDVNLNIFRRAVACDAPSFPDSDGLWRAEALQCSGGRMTKISVETQKRFDGKFQPARDRDQVTRVIEQTFDKLGNTNLKLGKLALHNPENVFVPVSALNAARREIAAALERKISELPRKYAVQIKSDIYTAEAEDSPKATPWQAQSSPACNAYGVAIAGRQRIIIKNKTQRSPRLGGEFKWSIKTDQPRLLEAFDSDDWKDIDEVIIELPVVAGGGLSCVAGLAKRDDPGPASTRPATIELLISAIGRENIRFALPVIMRAWEKAPLDNAVSDLISKGWHKWQISNPGGLSLLRGLCRDELDISADWPVYTMNLAAVSQLRELGINGFTLSLEDGLENMRAILEACPEEAVVAVYQDTPLMISETCVFAPEECLGGHACDIRERIFVSARGDKARITNRACRNIVLNERPFCLASHLDELAAAGAHNLRADFIYRAYKAQEMLDVWRRLRSGAKVSGCHDANFERGLR